MIETGLDWIAFSKMDPCPTLFLFRRSGKSEMGGEGICGTEVGSRGRASDWVRGKDHLKQRSGAIFVSKQTELQHLQISIFRGGVDLVLFLRGEFPSAVRLYA